MTSSVLKYNKTGHLAVELPKPDWLKLHLWYVCWHLRNATLGQFQTPSEDFPMCCNMYWTMHSNAWELPCVSQLKARATRKDLQMISPHKSAYREEWHWTLWDSLQGSKRTNKQARRVAEKGSYPRFAASEIIVSQNLTLQEVLRQVYNSRNSIMKAYWKVCSEMVQS